MSQRLIFVMGPSGAGKDSVLDWLRQHLPAQQALHWTRRTITRPADAGGEQHEAITPADFAAQKAAGAFALTWQAHDLCYGIRQSELAPLARGEWVVVNGSREYLAQAMERFPGLSGVLITASPAILAQRLAARKRENAEQIAERLRRSAAFQLPPGMIVIHNDGRLEEAGAALLAALQALPGWPAPVNSGPEGL